MRAVVKVTVLSPPRSAMCHRLVSYWVEGVDLTPPLKLRRSSYLLHSPEKADYQSYKIFHVFFTMSSPMLTMPMTNGERYKGEPSIINKGGALQKRWESYQDILRTIYESTN
jgi:hypothetical protein